jgi:iron complex outermembrane recepter protein
LWTPRARQSFWASITRAVRIPSRLDEDLQLSALLLANPPIFLRVAGTGHFLSERLIAYETGVRSLLCSRLYVDVAAFHNSYGNLYGYGAGYPVLESTPPPPRLLLVAPIGNVTEGTGDGFEVAPDWRPSSWWQLKGSYSYMRLDLRTKPGTGTDALQPLNILTTEGSSPHHQVVIQSLLNLPKKLELDQTYRYVSGLPAQLIAGYGTADARFGWRPTPNLELSLVERTCSSRIM